MKEHLYTHNRIFSAEALQDVSREPEFPLIAVGGAERWRRTAIDHHNIRSRWALVIKHPQRS